MLCSLSLVSARSAASFNSEMMRTHLGEDCIVEDPIWTDPNFEWNVSSIWCVGLRMMGHTRTCISAIKMIDVEKTEEWFFFSLICLPIASSIVMVVGKSQWASRPRWLAILGLISRWMERHFRWPTNKCWRISSQGSLWTFNGNFPKAEQHQSD